MRYIISLSFLILITFIGTAQPFDKNYSNNANTGGIGLFAKQTPDGGFLLMMNVNINQLKLVKTDPGGFVQWSREYDLFFVDLMSGPSYTSSFEFGTFNSLPCAVVVGNTVPGPNMSNPTVFIAILNVDLATGNVNYYNKAFPAAFIPLDDFMTGAHISGTADGGHVITGRSRGNATQGPGTTHLPFIMRLDAAGSLMFFQEIVGGPSSNPFGNNYYMGLCVEQAIDGGFIVSGNQTQNGNDFLLKTDASGNVLWSTSLMYNSPAMYLKEFPNGDIVVLNESGHLSRTDANGSLIWQRDYSSVDLSGAFFMHALDITSSGDIVVAGFVYDGITRRGLVYKLDGNGIPVWARQYNSTQQFHSIEVLLTGQLLLGGFSVSGYGELARINADGSMGNNCELPISLQSISTNITNFPLLGNVPGGGISGTPTSSIAGIIEVQGCCPVGSVAITGPQSTCDVNFTYCTPVIPGYTYAWTASAGVVLSSSLGNCVTVTFWGPYQTSGVATITVTLTDNIGCTLTGTIQVAGCCTQPTPSCPSNPNLYNTSVSQTISNCCLLFNICTLSVVEIEGKFFSINGTFTVDQDLIIKNCDVLLGPNAKIDILPGRTLTITNDILSAFSPSRLHACNTMWDGIYVNAGSNLNINSYAFIEDALNSVVSLGGGNFQINDAWFNKNFISIDVRPFNGAHPGTVSNCRFTTRNIPIAFSTISTPAAIAAYPPASLLPPHSYLGRSYIGIQLDQVQNGGFNAITLGDPAQGQNIFDRMHNGIVGAASHFTVLNGYYQFIDNPGSCIQACPLCPCLSIGNGIHAIKSGKLIAGDNTVTGQNSFNSSAGGHGIRADNVDLDLRLNLFNGYANAISPAYGIFVSNQSLRSSYIFNNRFTNMSNGMLIRGTVSSGFQILDNHFNQFQGTGIWFLQVRDCAINIQGNTFNTAPNNLTGRYGIRLQNAIIGSTNQAVTVWTNDIRNCEKGIWLTGFPEVDISHGNLIRFPSQVPTTPSFGIHVQNSPGTLIDQNTVFRNGVNPNAAFDSQLFGYSIDNSPGTIVKNNIARKTGTGFRFFGMNLPFCTFICNEMDRNRIDLLFDNTNIGPQGTTSSASDNRWLNYGGQLFDVSCVSGAPPGNTYRTQGPVPPWSPSVSNMSPPNAIVVAPAPSQNTCNPPCNNPPCNQPLLAQIVRENAPFNSLTNEEKYLAKRTVYRKIRENSLLLNLNTQDDTILQVFFDSAGLGNLGKVDRLGVLITIGDTAQAYASTSVIVPENQIEDNHINVSRVYLRSWASGITFFTSIDTMLLESIAFQDPLYGGAAVYDARVMLGMNVFDDGNLINKLESVEGRPEVIHDPSGIFYPSPASGEAIYECELSDGEYGLFRIIDSYGRSLEQKVLVPGFNRLIVQLKSFATGVYSYETFINERNVARRKFIVIR